MGYDEDQDSVIEWTPAKDAVLTQGPFAVQTFFEMDEIATLAETHLTGEAGQLIEIWRIVGHPPNTRLRKIVQFHPDRQ